jgi:hypothetical protein
MLDTMAQYGQTPPKLAITDNAIRDCSMLKEEMESLRDTQYELHKFTKSRTLEAAGMESNILVPSCMQLLLPWTNIGTELNATPFCKINDPSSCYKVVSKVVDVNVLAEAI